jgi:putative PIN family toxin of toxin-antitoxin system
MADDRWRVFLDTSVLISGTISRTGGSATILDLGEAEEILVVVSRQVLIEADRVFSAKFPEFARRFRDFLHNLAPLVVEDPSSEAVREAAEVIHPDDAAILAAARSSSLDYLVTLDARHFKTPQVRAYLSIPAVSPGEFLAAFRAFWEERE